MPIADYHFYHGAALSLIVSEGDFTGLARIGTAAYAINHDIGIYIKHTTMNDGPWQFTFAPEHQEAIRELFKKYEEKAFIALVCGREGVCLLEYGEYAAMLDENFQEPRGITVERPEGGGFRFRGRLGRFNRVIPLNRFPPFLFRK